MKVFQAVANAFVKEGTTTVFGLLGDGQIGWWSAIAKHPGVRIIDVRDEGAALSMADGWAQATGKVGICSTTHGPGVTRLATSLVVSSRAHTPIVVLVSSAALNDENNAQYLNQERFVTSTGAGYIEIRTPQFAEEAVREAFYLAKRDSKPMVLSIPLDIQDKECNSDGDDYEPSSTFYPGQQRIRGDLEQIQKALSLIKGAKKPVVLLGMGARSEAAVQAAGALAKRVGALTATSLLAKGTLGDDEFHAGVCGSFAHRTALQLFEESDCVIAAGASLNRYTMEGGYIFPNARLIHINVERHSLMGNRRGADCYIQGDAETVLQELADAVVSANHENTGYRTSATRNLLKEATADNADFSIPQGTVDPRAVASTIESMLPLDVAIGYGAGHQKSFPLLALRTPRRVQFTTTAFGSIGQALGTALGVCVGLENKPVVMFDGDGSALQNIQELETAGRLGINLLYVIMNDEGYGSEYHKLISKKLDGNLSVVATPDFGAVGRSFGCRGMLIKNLDDLKKGVSEFLSKSGPMVLDVRIARTVVSTQFRRALFGQDA